MKDRVVRWIKILISIILMLLLLSKVNFRELKDVLYNTKIDGVIVVVGAYLISIALNAVKWNILLPTAEMRFLLSLSFRAQLYATVLPGQLFGEASKVTAWADRDEDTATVAASVVFDKITGIIGQIMIGAFGLCMSSKTSEIENKWIIFVGLFLILGGVFISTESHVSSFNKKIISKTQRISNRLENKLMTFYEAWILFSTRKIILLKSIAWGIINQMIGVISIYYFSNRMGLEVGFIEYCWIIPLMSVILLLPISFAGIGLRDASLAAFLILFGVSTGNSLVISVSMLLGQLVGAGIGAIYVLGHNIKKGVKK